MSTREKLFFEAVGNYREIAITWQALERMSPAMDGASRFKSLLVLATATGSSPQRFEGVAYGLGQPRAAVFQYTGAGAWLDILRVPKGVVDIGEHPAYLYPLAVAQEIRKVTSQLSNPLVRDPGVKKSLEDRRNALEWSKGMLFTLNVHVLEDRMSPEQARRDAEASFSTPRPSSE